MVSTTRSRLHFSCLMCALVLVRLSSHRLSPCTGGKGEILPLQSVTLTDKQFLMGEKVASLLRWLACFVCPVSNDRLPVVILLHGSGGIVDFVTDWEQYLNSMGVATFTIDSFTGRGIDNVGTISHSSAGCR